MCYLTFFKICQNIAIRRFKLKTHYIIFSSKSQNTHFPVVTKQASYQTSFIPATDSVAFSFERFSDNKTKHFVKDFEPKILVFLVFLQLIFFISNLLSFFSKVIFEHFSVIQLFLFLVTR